MRICEELFIFKCRMCVESVAEMFLILVIIFLIRALVYMLLYVVPCSTVILKAIFKSCMAHIDVALAGKEN